MQVTLAPGASEAAPAGQVAADSVPVPENAPSLTVIVFMVTLPLLVTLNE